MLALTTTTWWVIGYVIATLVVLLVATLLLVAIALVRKIVGQAAEITTALEGARDHTAPLVALAEANSKLEQTVLALALLRERRGEEAASNGGLLGTIREHLPRGDG